MSFGKSVFDCWSDVARSSSRSRRPCRRRPRPPLLSLPARCEHRRRDREPAEHRAAPAEELAPGHARGTVVCDLRAADPVIAVAHASLLVRHGLQLFDLERRRRPPTRLAHSGAAAVPPSGSQHDPHRVARPQQRELLVGPDVRDERAAVGRARGRSAPPDPGRPGRPPRRAPTRTRPAARRRAGACAPGRIMNVAGSPAPRPSDRVGVDRGAVAERSPTPVRRRRPSIVAGSRFAMPMKPATNTVSGSW